VYLQGEGILRSELNALSRDHVEAIVTGYRVRSTAPLSNVKVAPTSELIEAIIAEARGSQLGGSNSSSEIANEL
jgi:hypothetical protein